MCEKGLAEAEFDPGTARGIRSGEAREGIRAAREKTAAAPCGFVSSAL